MVAILFNGPEPFEQIGNTLLTDDPMWNLVKIAQAVSEKKTYMYIAQGQGQITPGDKIVITTKKFYYFNHSL